MKFVLSSKISYFWPVTVRMPNPDAPGEIVEQTFQMRFTPQTQDEAIASNAVFQKLSTVEEQISHERANLMKVCTGWDDVVDADKNAIAFTQENLLMAMQQPWFRTGVNDALAESQNGQAARLGN